MTRSGAEPGGPMQGSATSLNRHCCSPSSTLSLLLVAQSRIAAISRTVGLWEWACGGALGAVAKRIERPARTVRIAHLPRPPGQCRSRNRLGSTANSGEYRPAPSSAPEFWNVQNLQIDGQRLWDTLMNTAQIGATPKGGICRLTLTDLDRQVRD